MKYNKHQSVAVVAAIFLSVCASLTFMCIAYTAIIRILSRVSILLLTRDIDIVILSVRLSVCP